MMLARRTPLSRGAGLAPMSAKRREKLADSGVLNPFSTLTNSAGLDRAAVGRGRKPRPVVRHTGPDAATVALVIARDEGRCVRCGRVITGARGMDWSVQHRSARGMGGTSREVVNTPPALILLCGSATTGCHGRVESRRAEAQANGWAVSLHADPAEVAVKHAVHGWVYLTADGGWRPAGGGPC